MIPITIICTSCDRWDLFTQTLDSFFALNKYPYVAFHVHNDSVKAIPQEIKKRYKDKGITWHEGTKRGLSAAWDYLIALIETEYFFNLEDDWFFEGNEKFIDTAISFCIYHEAHQCWVRHHKDHNHPIDVVRVQKIKNWCGFSFNPSVRSLSKWKELFPIGISGKDEIDISREVYNNYKAVSIINTACKHIGNGRHTKGFKI